jgi:[acyl-carrier-protein] S-malonyltransferase
MAAIVGLPAEEVEAACAEAEEDEIVSPANYNSPEQTVIAGRTESVARAGERCLARGAKRVIPLAVSAPFHCALMAPARERMRPLIERVEMRDGRMPVVTNVAARAEWRFGELRLALVRQIDSPVRWVESVHRLAKEGVDRAIEIGPGKVLAGLVKRIEPGIPVQGHAGPA